MKTLLILLSMALVTNSYGSERKFCRSVIKGKVDKVQSILKSTPEAINYRCTYKHNTFSPLTWSHLTLNAKMSDLLLKNGADIKQSLKEFSLNDIIQRVRNNMNCRYVYNCSFVDYAINIPHLADSVSINDVSNILKNGDYPLDNKSKITFIKNLVADGFDLTQTIGDNANSLLFYTNNIDMLKLLIADNVNPAYTNILGDSFFTNAFKGKATQEFLLSAAQLPGVKLDQPGANAELPLFLSLQKNMDNLFNYIFDKTSPEANSTDTQGRSFVHYSFSDIAKTSFFLELGTDINTIDNEGQTALFLAVKANDKTATFYLLENGACKDVVNTQGRTPLSYAIDNNNAEVIELLSKYPSGC